MTTKPTIKFPFEIVELDDGTPRGDGPATVYAAYSPEGELLYVGQTVLLRNRLLKHRTTSGWFKRCGILRIVSGLSEIESLHLEHTLVQEFDPPWNSKARDPQHPRNLDATEQVMADLRAAGKVWSLPTFGGAV